VKQKVMATLLEPMWQADWVMAPPHWDLAQRRALTAAQAMMATLLEPMWQADWVMASPHWDLAQRRALTAATASLVAMQQALISVGQDQQETSVPARRRPKRLSAPTKPIEC
jgi:hypothetical protein